MLDQVVGDSEGQKEYFRVVVVIAHFPGSEPLFRWRFLSPPFSPFNTLDNPSILETYHPAENLIST